MLIEDRTCGGHKEAVTLLAEVTLNMITIHSLAYNCFRLAIDHVHLCLSIPPKISIGDFMGYLKGKSALMIFDKHPELGSKWDRTFWARGYYVSTVGNVDEETIKKYIREQQEESRKEDRTLR